MSRRRRPAGLELEPTYFQEWRKAKRFTLAQASKHMGIDATAISRIERHLVPYDQIHLQQMSKLYDVLIPDLLYRDPKRPRPAEDLVKLVNKLERSEDVREVTALVELLLAKR
jgi:transcriptional regulator with XRE-family HTH domain